jgi:hypothetical protein
MKIIETIHDIQTGETTVTERDETAAETKARLALAKEAAAFAEAKAKAEADKAALLARLGLTEDEAKLLLS